MTSSWGIGRPSRAHTRLNTVLTSALLGLGTRMFKHLLVIGYSNLETEFVIKTNLIKDDFFSIVARRAACDTFESVWQLSSTINLGELVNVIVELSVILKISFCNNDLSWPRRFLQLTIVTDLFLITSNTNDFDRILKEYSSHLVWCTSVCTRSMKNAPTKECFPHPLAPETRRCGIAISVTSARIVSWRRAESSKSLIRLGRYLMCNMNKS